MDFYNLRLSMFSSRSSSKFYGEMIDVIMSKKSEQLAAILKLENLKVLRLS